MITTACPRCQRQLTYQDEHGGMQGQCDGCGSVFVIPEPTTPTTPPPRPGGSQQQSNSPLDSLAQLSGGQQSGYQGDYQQGGYQQGGYQQGGYQGGYSPQYQSPPSYRYSGGESHFGMAIAGFILSLTVPLLGLIFSLIALSGMKKSRNMEGHGFAVAGMIISIAFVALGCLWSCVVFGLFNAALHR